MPWGSWRSGSTAFSAPSETLVEPPVMPHFSSTMTLAPACTAAMAAARPEPPPTTHTSAS